MTLARKVQPRKVDVREVQKLVTRFRDLTEKSRREGVEYHAEIYRHKGKVHLTEIRKGSKFEVRSTPHKKLVQLQKQGAVKIGAFHTHPQGRGEASFRDEMSYMVFEGIKNPGKSFDVIGSREGIRIRTVSPEQRKTKGYEKVTNLAYRFMTGTYGSSRAEGMLARIKKKHGYPVKEINLPLSPRRARNIRKRKGF